MTPEGEELIRVRGILAVVGSRASRKPPAPSRERRGLRHHRAFITRQTVRPGQVAHDERFEAFFGGVGGHDSGG